MVSFKLSGDKSFTYKIYWVKSDWVDDAMLLNEYKPDGFDFLYKDEELEYK